MNIKELQAYRSFLEHIKTRVQESQHKALRQVNNELISLYWSIGKTIAEKQQQYNWGKSIVETLSKDLQKEFVGVKGFSSQNLWYMRQFFWNIKITKDSNHWLEKSVGQNILSS